MDPGKKTVIAAALVLVAAAALLLIQGAPPANAGIASASKDTVRMGVLLPLSGEFAFMGNDIKNAMELAQDQINAKSDTKIKLLFEDTRMDPKEGVSAARKLLESDGVPHLYVAFTPIVLATQPLTEARETVMVAASINSQLVEETRHTVRVFYNNQDAAAHLAQYIREGGYARVAVLYERTEAMESQIQRLREAGVTFAAEETYLRADTDFRTQLTKIKSANPDLLLVLGYGVRLPTIYRQIHELGMESVPKLGDLDYLDLPQGERAWFEGAAFVAPAFAVNPTEKRETFKRDYEARYGKEPGYVAAYAYDAVAAWHAAVAQAGSDPAAVREHMGQMGTFTGVSGDITFYPNGDTTTQLAWATYRDGKVAALEK